MKALLGAVAVLLVISGIWAVRAAPSAIMSQLPIPLQVFFAFSLLAWIASGVVLFLYAIGD